MIEVIPRKHQVITFQVEAGKVEVSIAPTGSIAQLLEVVEDALPSLFYQP